MEGDNPFTVPQTPFNKAPFPHIALFSPEPLAELSSGHLVLEVVL